MVKMGRGGGGGGGGGGNSVDLKVVETLLVFVLGMVICLSVS